MTRQLAGNLIVGSIYQDTAPGRYTPAPASPARERLIAKITDARTAAWDSDQERSFDALLEVLDCHRPWQIWRQTFAPTYIGDRYHGVGCRSCDWSSATDCPTVRAIARSFGVESEPWTAGDEIPTVLPLHNRMSDLAGRIVGLVLDRSNDRGAVGAVDFSSRLEVLGPAADDVERMITDYLNDPR